MSVSNPTHDAYGILQDIIGAFWSVTAGALIGALAGFNLVLAGAAL